VLDEVAVEDSETTAGALGEVTIECVVVAAVDEAEVRASEAGTGELEVIAGALVEVTVEGTAV
jgi:hypothetical protein